MSWSRCKMAVIADVGFETTCRQVSRSSGLPHFNKSWRLDKVLMECSMEDARVGSAGQSCNDSSESPDA